MSRTRSIWPWILAIMIGTAVFGPAGNAAPIEDPTLPVITLGKVTRVRATAHSLALLKVPEDVGLRALRDRISGGGRVAGYALTNWTEDQDDGDLLVQSFVVNRCLKPGCPPAKHELRIRWSEGVANGVIPAGIYRLYVVADRAPVEIAFKNRYLSGKTATKLAGDYKGADVITLPMSPASTDSGTIFSAGDFTSLEPGRGIGLLGLWSLGSPFAAGAVGDCFYFDDLLAPREETAFLPGCPTGWGARPHVGGPVAPGERGGVIFQSTHHRLPLGIGGWAGAAGRVDDFGAVGLWLRF